MELDSVAKHREAFYRLTGSLSSDGALTKRGEATDEVANLCLTRGSRLAQRWMLEMGYEGWRKRSPAITWVGADETHGGRYTALPMDFLKAYGGQRRSALCSLNGDRWGTEITSEEDDRKGNYYYYRGEQIWIARTAQPPVPVYMDYQYKHPEWESLTDEAIDFPVDARYLIVAEAANVGKDENWLPAGREMKAAISEALYSARQEARRIARRGKGPRQIRPPKRFGNRW
jgi:hypothetical protein